VGECERSQKFELYLAPLPSIEIVPDPAGKRPSPWRVTIPSLVGLGQTVRASLRRSAEKWPTRLSRSLKVIGTDTDPSATYDFLLVIHSAHLPISYRFRGKRQFPSEIANFPHPRIFSASAKGELTIRGWGKFAVFDWIRIL